MASPTALAGDGTERAEGVHLLMLVAIAALILYHYTYARAGEASIASLQGLARLGFLGIDVFLMASGYLIVWGARGHSALQFVRSRVLRRFPEFWLAVLISGTLFHFAPIHPGRYPDAGTVVANLSMVPQVLGFEMVDSLYALLFEELQFTFVIWAVILLGLFEQVEVVLFAIVGLSLAGTAVTLPFVVRAIIDYPVGPLFAIGGLLALIRQSGWTASRAIFLFLAAVGGSILAMREMADYVDPSEITTVATTAVVVTLVVAAVALARFGGRTLDPRLGRYGAIVAGLAYPLLLLESTGKALFLRGLVHGPRALLALIALAFSLTIALIVRRVGTGPVRTGLRIAFDRVTASTGRGHSASRIRR